MHLDVLNALDADAAARELRRCCGSSRWAAQMTGSRPFTSAETMADTADRIWSGLDPADWLEAFAAHPRIGDSAKLPVDDARPSGTAAAGSGDGEQGWPAQEQAGVGNAAVEVRQRLAERNREYESRFGYIFIVCASGLDGATMLRLLESRLANEPAIELRIAANEQRKITRLRLDKLLHAA
jgi:OHCU decarboxylase